MALGSMMEGEDAPTQYGSDDGERSSSSGPVWSINGFGLWEEHPFWAAPDAWGLKSYKSDPGLLRHHTIVGLRQLVVTNGRRAPATTPFNEPFVAHTRMYSCLTACFLMVLGHFAVNM